jgi:hypothetical protein
MRREFIVIAVIGASAILPACSTEPPAPPDAIVLREPIYPRNQSQIWTMECSRQTMTIERSDKDRTVPTIKIDGKRIDTASLAARLKASSSADIFNLQFRGTACPENGADSFSVEATSYGDSGRALFFRFFANRKGVQLWPETTALR